MEEPHAAGRVGQLTRPCRSLSYPASLVACDNASPFMYSPYVLCKRHVLGSHAYAVLHVMMIPHSYIRLVYCPSGVIDGQKLINGIGSRGWKRGCAGKCSLTS